MLPKAPITTASDFEPADRSGEKGDVTVAKRLGVCSLRDRDPDDDFQRWAAALAHEGWRLWPIDTGVPVIINGREVIR